LTFRARTRIGGKPADLLNPMKGTHGNGGCAAIIQKCEYGEIVVAVSLPFDSWALSP
tara:strand:+ start:143 stop:313 length:171 start_codon:yes stop_codon:yes gene_type:complete